MLTDDEIRNIGIGLIPIRIIWLLLVILCGVYLIIAHVTGKEGTVTGGDEPDEVFNLVGYILYALGAILLGIAYYVRKAIANQKSLVWRIFNAISQANPQVVIIIYINGIILCLALMEAIAIYGLIIFMINADYFSLYLLIGIAVAALVYFRPKKQELIDLTMQLKQDNQM